MYGTLLKRSEQTVKLCPTCLHEINKKMKICPVCASKIPRGHRTVRKIMPTVISFLLLLVLTLFFIHKSQSEQTITSKFEESIADRDWQSLQRLIIHADHSTITKIEAQAVTNLIEVMGEVDLIALFKVVETNPFLKTYKIQAPEVSLLLQEDTFRYAIKDADSSNLIPGIYAVEATASSDLLPTTKTIQTKITAKNTKIAHLLATSRVMFPNTPITGFHAINIKINDQITPMTTLLNEAPIQVFLGNFIEFQYILKAPWGTITSQPEIIDNLFNQSGIKYIQEKQKKDILKSINNAHKYFTNHPYDTSLLTKKTLNQPLKFEDIVDIDDFSILSLTLDKMNKINGFHAIYSAQVEGNNVQLIANFLYDERKKLFIVDGIYSDQLPSNNISISNHSLQQQISYDVTLFSPVQLKSYFKTIYPNALAFYSPDSPKKLVTTTGENMIYQNLQHFSTEKINVIDSNTVKMTTINVYNNARYEVHSLFEMDENYNWFITEIEPMKLLQ